MDNKVSTIIAEVEKARKGIAVCAVLFLALAVLCFAFSERVLLVLVRLLGKKLVSYSPEEGFIALASLSLYCAFVLMLPVAGYLLWRRLILPRVPAWRRWGGPVIAVAAALFACGVLLGYFVLLPAGIGFLVGFKNRNMRALISAKKFISFCGMMLIALGLSFEAPLSRLFPCKLGWLKPEFFRNRAVRHHDLHRPGGRHHSHARHLQHDADDDAAPGALFRLLSRRRHGRSQEGIRRHAGRFRMRTTPVPCQERWDSPRSRSNRRSSSAGRPAVVR